MNKLAKATGIVAILLAGGGAAAWQWLPGLHGSLRSFQNAGGGTSNDVNDIKLHVAKRGPLRISINEEGKLRAVKNFLIYPQLRNQMKITWVAPEGSKIKKGDKIVEFDKKDYEDQLNTLRGDLATAKRQLEVNEEAVKIQESTGNSAVAVAETKMGQADVDLRTYQNLDAPKQLNTIGKDMIEARTKLADAQHEADLVQQKLDDELFEEDQRTLLEQQLASHNEALNTAKGTIDALVQQKRIFRAYDYPQNMDAKIKALKNAKLEVEKARVEAKSALTQKTSDVAKVTEQVARQQRTIDMLTDQIEKCVMTAPVDGLVLYGDQSEDNRIMYSGQQIQAGASWYGGNALLTIPDLSSFIVEIQVAEEYRGRLIPGAKARITVQAVPGLELTGKLTDIASLARPRVSYDAASPKVFSVKLQPDGSDPRLVSGMTARVEIVTDELQDVLYVPIECLFNVDGKTICYVQTPEGPIKREVKPGKSNDHFVQIIEGITEGENVYASDPLGAPKS
jgi:HlyD family secretion protein